MPPDALLDELADAILDGTPIDWADVELRAGPAARVLVDELKALAALRSAGQTLGSGGRGHPSRWGHLRVLDSIGRGAFGEVYRAWETSLDREVALKLLPVSGSGDEASPSVIEEGRLLARVRHPNVVTIHGAERIDGRIGLWMEFIKGRTLEQLLREEGKRFTVQEVARIGVELCSAVSAVHAAGLVHRDIKAQNVMLADDGRLVLMDFGTGLDMRGGAEVGPAGTPLYLAPEVLAGGPATVQSDVYSIGVLLYHLLTNAFPIQARDLADLRRAHASGERTSLQRARPDVSQRFARVIERALDPAPDKRHEHAESLRAALVAESGARPLMLVACGVGAVLAVVVVAWYAGALNAGAPRPRMALASSASAGTNPSQPLAIAVLPFRNLSSAPDTGHFADGLTEEITRNLTPIRGLQLRSQTSSAYFKDEPHNVARIGELLGVNLIVTGSVQRDGRRLRVSAQLVSVDGDVLLWSVRYDRTLEEVFAIQDEISRAVATRLNLTLASRPAYRPPLDAYELYLQARAKLVRRDTANAQAAARLFEQVIARDPEYAPAHAGLADAYAAMSWQIPGLSPQEGLRRMRPAAARAIELDPMLAEAHGAMGMTHARALDWESARKSFERAIELNPSLTHIQTYYADSTLLQLGEANRAVQMLEAALVTDPMSLDVRRGLAFAQIVAGRYEEAIAHLRQAAAVDSDLQSSNLQLARALTFAGRPQEAVALWESRRESEPGWERWLTHAYVRLGRHADVARLVRSNRTDHPYRQALVYSAVGDVDRTFAALNGAVDLMPQRTALLLVLPEMALLRGDARLASLRQRLKIP